MPPKPDIDVRRLPCSPPNARTKAELLESRESLPVVFGGSRVDNVVNEWDGEFTIAALESPGVEVFHHTEFLADGDGKAVWAPFSKHGTLANSDTSWASASGCGALRTSQARCASAPGRGM